MIRVHPPPQTATYNPIYILAYLVEHKNFNLRVGGSIPLYELK